MEDALRPLGQKVRDTHWVANVYKEPQSSPIPPSPTPTNTITPTPTSGRCVEIYLEAGGFGSNFYWIDCDGNPATIYLPDYDSTIVCGKEFTAFYDGAGLINYLGPCPSPTPTPTPSSTPPSVDCTWSGANINWEDNTNLWDDCQPLPPQPSPSETPTNTPTGTPTNTPTETPTNTPTGTPTGTPTPTPTNTPTPSQTPLTGQTEANTYMSAVISGGGTLDATMSGATYQLFNDLFVSGLWNKLYSFYPLLGGNSSGGQAVNGKTPGTRNITWNGGLTFSTNGVVSNGSTGYGDLNSNPFNLAPIDDFHMSVYSRTNITTDFAQQDMGAFVSTAQRTQINIRTTNDDTRSAVNTSGGLGMYSNNDSRGLFTVVRRTSTDTESYRNSTSLGNSNTTSTNRPNGNLWLAARNWINNFPSPLVEAPTTRQYAFVTTGNALSDSEVADLYTAIQTFQTTLGRQV
jgi:hypothetical protein